VPDGFPTILPAVRETHGRIPPDFHKLTNGDLCLGSHTRLRLLMGKDSSLLRFVKNRTRRTYSDFYTKLELTCLDHAAATVDLSISPVDGLRVTPFPRGATQKPTTRDGPQPRIALIG
jgi:hypothetical protein